MFGASEETHVEHLQNTGIDFVQTVSSVFCDGVEVILRPASGTRYTPPAVQFFSMTLMAVGSAILTLLSNFMQMIPLVQVHRQVGMFGLADYAKFYFLICAIHGVRKWRRMINPALELHSEYEGPALPFFRWLPNGSSFWFVRIVLEPVFVWLVSIVLADLFIAQQDLVIYLRVAAFALLAKNFISWFRAWEYIRKILDMRNAGPIIAKLVENDATPEELAPMHLASFPKNIDPQVRKAAAIQIAQRYSPENPNF
jgi:hypothetical protein